MILRMGLCKKEKKSLYLLDTHTEVSIGKMIWYLRIALKPSWRWEWGRKCGENQ